MVYKSSVNSGGSGGGVTSLNSLTGGLSLTSTGATITITPSGSTINLEATSGSGTVTTTGTPASGNLTKFSGATSITNSDLSGDVTTSGTLVTTVAKINGVALGTTTATSGNLLIGSGTQWITQSISGSGATIALGATGVITISSIANASLSNSSITISGHAISLGGSQNLVASDVGLGSVTNDAQTKAAIVPNTAPSAGQILVGNAGGTAYAPVSVSGSGATISLSSAGAITISAIANASLANSTISGVALGSNLNALSATDSTLTFSGSYTGATARTVGINLGNANTWTATQTQKCIVDSNNAITASANAATVPITSRLNTVTNNSAATLTITMATASAVDGQMSIVRILDATAAAQTITWVNTENSTVSAPTTSNGSTTSFLTVGFIYNGGTSKWRCIASA